MALTVKTIVKLYLLFFVFQIGTNIFIETMPTIHQVSSENQEYLDFITGLVNGDFNTQATGTTLLTNFEESMQRTDLINESIWQSFLGILVVIGSVLWFLFQLALSLLFTPTIIMQILFYNMIASSYFLVTSLIVNIFFYMTLFYIVFKGRTQQ
jgi:hypothetical protein